MRKKNVFIFANAKVSHLQVKMSAIGYIKPFCPLFDTMRKLSQFCRIILRNTRAAKRVDAQQRFRHTVKRGKHHGNCRYSLNSKA